MSCDILAICINVSALDRNADMGAGLPRGSPSHTAMVNGLTRRIGSKHRDQHPCGTLRGHPRSSITCYSETMTDSRAILPCKIKQKFVPSELNSMSSAQKSLVWLIVMLLKRDWLLQPFDDRRCWKLLHAETNFASLRKI